MAQACAFADEADPLRARSKGHDVIIGQILQQVTQCAYFIKGYWQDESFGKADLCLCSIPFGYQAADNHSATAY